MSNNVNLQCSICLDNVTLPEGKEISSFKRETLAFEGSDSLSDSTAPVATKCNHIFHECCLNNWIAKLMHETQAASCPTCSTEILPAHVVLPQEPALPSALEALELSSDQIASIFPSGPLLTQNFYLPRLDPDPMPLFHPPRPPPEFNRRQQLLMRSLLLQLDHSDPANLPNLSTNLKSLIDLLPRSDQLELRKLLNLASTKEDYLGILLLISQSGTWPNHWDLD